MSLEGSEAVRGHEVGESVVATKLLKHLVQGLSSGNVV